jgi:squalene-hopene/tetraprenyl-beta-curcumene cyclase
MEAQWLLALHVMGLRRHRLVPELTKAILQEQRSDGSWAVYPDSPAGDVNTTVECYAALRAYGHDPDAPDLRSARTWILERNALRNIRVFTRYWLALIGVWPWSHTPNLPPEVIRFPRRFVFSIYNFSSWARATLLPLALLSARRPVVPLPNHDQLDELFPGGRDGFDFKLPRRSSWFSWERFFLVADRCLHALQDWGMTPGRSVARARVRDWIVAHQDADGVWGGIQPPWVYSLMALHHEGYRLDHPVMQAGLDALEDPRWRIRDGDASYISASVSPIWDTVLMVQAVQDCEAVDSMRSEVERALDWLASKQVMDTGDWTVKVPDGPPGGWAFEYENRWYPDVDDTAVVLSALIRAGDPRYAEAIRAGMGWMKAMQCSNGGWAAFDRDNDNTFLTKIPFCDFGEALDPPSVDVTAHVLEALAHAGLDRNDRQLEAGLQFILREQEPDGSWFGRWGVNHIYGLGSALPALRAVGYDLDQPHIARGLDWLKRCQNDDGGWGESCASYMDASQRGRGASTPSQTAWALMALEAARRPADRDAAVAGVGYLLDRQSDGTWDESAYTGTGFPGYGVGLRVEVTSELEEQLSQGPELSRAFMIGYHMYRHYFPLMALGRMRRWLSGG